jgi:hypothetical protein
VYCIVISFGVVCCTAVHFISNCLVACALDLRNLTCMCACNRWHKGEMLFVVSVGACCQGHCKLSPVEKFVV